MIPIYSWADCESMCTPQGSIAGSNESDATLNGAKVICMGECEIAGAINRLANVLQRQEQLNKSKKEK